MTSKIKQYKYITIIPLLLVCILLVYMFRYQWFGYWKIVEIDYTIFSVNTILSQLDRIIDKHMKLSGNYTYDVQVFEITPDKLYLVYNGYNSNNTPYVLYLYIDRSTNRSMFSVGKSSKEYGPAINPDEWHYELEYFSSIFGYNYSYLLHHPMSNDELKIYSNECGYIGNLYDGSYAGYGTKI